MNISRQEGGRCGEGKSRTESGVAVGQGRGEGWTGGRSSNLLKGERRREIKWCCDFFLSRAVLYNSSQVKDSSFDDVETAGSLQESQCGRVVCCDELHRHETHERTMRGKGLGSQAYRGLKGTEWMKAAVKGGMKFVFWREIVV